MAYETGSSPDVIDLLDRLEIFAVNNGWTSNKREKPGDGSSELYLYKSDVGYFVFQSDDNAAPFKGPRHLKIYGATGFDTNKAYDNQPGSSHEVPTTFLSGSFGVYHFFTDENSNYLYVVVENSDATWRHFGVGIASKYFSFTGGEYAYGSYWPDGDLDIADNGTAWPLERTAAWGGLESDIGVGSAFRADVNGNSDYWLQYYDASYEDQSVATSRVTSTGDFYGHMFDLTPISYNFLSVLFRPIFGFYYSDNTYSIIANAVDFAYMNIEYYTAGDEFALGSETWKVFPVAAKRFTGNFRTGHYGIAIRKV